MSKRRCSVVLLLFSVIPLIHSQEKVISFDNNWTLNLSLNYHLLQFDHENLFGCRGNKPLDLGIGARYKKLALGFNIELPAFAELFQSSPESFDLNFDFYGEGFIANFSFSRYNSFIIYSFQDYQKYQAKDPVTESVDLDIISAGLSLRWILNYETHSLRGVYKLDRKQTISSGSPMIGFGVYYHSVFSADNKLPGYETSQHFIYTGLLAGYSYTWIFGSGAFLNIDIVGGVNPGINTNEGTYMFVPALFPNLSFGFHFNTWSITSSFDVRFFIALQYEDNYPTDWHQLTKFNVTIFKISKRF